MKNSTTVVLISLLTISGCKSHENDFVGKYITLYSALVRDYYDLNKIQLEVLKINLEQSKAREVSF